MGLPPTAPPLFEQCEKTALFVRGLLPLSGVDGPVKGGAGLQNNRSGDFNGAVRNIHRKFHFPLLSDFVKDLKDLVGRVQ